MDALDLPYLRNAIGACFLQLQSESPTLEHEQDDLGWLLFCELGAGANYALIQAASPDAVRAWVDRLEKRSFEHYLFLCGAAIQQSSIIEKTYTMWDSLPFMALDLDKYVPSMPIDPRVRVATIQDRAQIVKLIADAFEMDLATQRTFTGSINHASPNVKTFVIEELGHVVATVSTSVVDKVAGIFSMVVDKKMQRRGLGGAVLRAALRYSHSLGAKLAVLYATKVGEPFYKSMGWETLEAWDLWVTSDSYETFEGLNLDANLPFLRLSYGRTLAELVKSVPDLIHDTFEGNWLVMPSALGNNFGLIQSKSRERNQELLNKADSTKRLSHVFQCGHANKQNLDLPTGWRQPSSVSAVVIDLAANENRLQVDPRVRKATKDDRQDMVTVMAEAFGADEDAMQPFTLGADHPSSAVVSWVIEVENKIQGVVTIVIDERAAHCWSLAITKAQRGRGLGKALLFTALRSALELNCTMGFTISDPLALPFFVCCGWLALETWTVLTNQSV